MALASQTAQESTSTGGGVLYDSFREYAVLLSLSRRLCPLPEVFMGLERLDSYLLLVD